MSIFKCILPLLMKFSPTLRLPGCGTYTSVIHERVHATADHGRATYSECHVSHIHRTAVLILVEWCTVGVHTRVLVQDDVNFPERCAWLVEKHCSALQDFTGERAPALALDIGCAVGGSSFHLTKAGFGNVLGMDYSSAFISAANQLKADGSAAYRTVIEGDITVRYQALISAV